MYNKAINLNAIFEYLTHMFMPHEATIRRIRHHNVPFRAGIGIDHGIDVFVLIIDICEA